MSRREHDFPRLEPGEPTLPRKRFMILHMEANVYEQATNLMPLEPPLPAPEPAPPVAEPVISWLAGWFDLAPRFQMGSSASFAVAPNSTLNITSSKKPSSEKTVGRC